MGVRLVSKRFEIDEDFVGGVIVGANIFTREGGWLVSGVGSEAKTFVTSEANAPGILRLETGSSSGDTCVALFGDSGSLCAANAIVELSFRFRLSHTTSISVLLGVFEDSTPLIADTSRALLYDTALATNYQSAQSESGSELIESSVAGSTTFRTVTFRKTADGALAAFIITDASGVVLERGVHTAEFIDSAQVRLVMKVQTLTAAARAVEIDRITLKTEDLTR
jgi:hypothetical protein